jgi:hypothetical protein
MNVPATKRANQTPMAIRPATTSAFGSADPSARAGVALTSLGVVLTSLMGNPLRSRGRRPRPLPAGSDGGPARRVRAAFQFGVGATVMLPRTTGPVP